MSSSPAGGTCPNCGREIDEAGLRFCPNCGAWLGSVARRADDAPAPEEVAPEAPPPLAPPSPPVPVLREPGPHNPWEAGTPPPAPYLARSQGGTEPGGKLLTNSAGLDAFLGFVAVLLVNLGLPATVRQVFGANGAGIAGNGFVLYLASVGVYLFVLRPRVPDFGRGWRAGLILLLILGVVAILLVVLVFLGLLAVCSNMTGTH
jgi:hypothetical protein